VAESADALVTALFHQHARRLTRVAFLLLEDQRAAEDVVQEAFLGLHRRWRSLRSADAALGYLQVAVVNGSRSTLRRRRTRRAHALPEPSPIPSAEAVVLAQAEFAAVARAVATLPRRQREVLVLRYSADLSEAEIARALDISPGTVKTHAARGLAALEVALKETS
jgi:RNA polymerase sigma-70 factor (sigma-E family)